MAEDLPTDLQQVDPLDQWVAFEIRRKRLAFAERQKDDERAVVWGHNKGGARIKIILSWMEKVAVPLADATIDQAKELRAAPEAIERARVRVAEFVKEMSDAAVMMAYHVGKDSPSVHVETRTRIQALNDDVDGAFRLAAGSSSGGLPPDGACETRTGDPGRPELGATLYLAEFERRAAAGELEPELIDEAKALLQWFKNEHPQQQAPSFKTIRNRIRPQFRQCTKLS